MLWSKQYYYFDLDRWLKEHKAHPLLGGAGRSVRNAEWFHMLNGDVISMPDKWEYPWYAAWDLAFHTIALSLVDFDFAKEQLLLMLRSLYSHPNGQMPAYEWNFSDVNPPVHAWATLFLYKFEKNLGREDLKFLERSFQGLMLNFNWWVNRKDPQGKNVFAGGFLGLDNIGVFDRSAQLPTGGSLEQADGTAWMAFYAQCMLEMALILADHDPVYEEVAFKFLENVIWINYAMDKVGEHGDDMWDEEDGFYYDVLRLPSGEAFRLKVRSMVGLLPLCASTVFEEDMVTRHPKFMELIALFKKRHPEVIAHVAPTVDGYIGHAGRRLLSPLTKAKLERILGYLLDENEFLSEYGIRALSRYHREHPFVFHVGGQEHRVEYLPGDSDSGMFGGNSNWRGPIWMPVNVLIVRGLLNLYGFYGDDFKVECPTGSGNRMNLFEVAKEISRRLASIFLRDASGRRPVHGGASTFQEDPHWRDLILFYEYFHGDNGAGIGASHQTGWTGLVARLLDLFGRLTAAGRAGDPQGEARGPPGPRSRWAATSEETAAMSTPRYPALFQVNTRVRLSELSAALGRKATLDDIPDAELDRLAADGFDLVWFLGVWQTGEAARRVSRSQARVARRVPPRPPRLPRRRRHRLLLRGPGLPGPRGLRRRRGARPPARAPEAPGPAPHPRLRPEPHGAGPPLGERAPGLLRRRDGGAARRAAPELLPRRQGTGRARPGVRARPLLRRLAGHAAAELRQPGPPGGDARRAAAHRAPVRRRPLRHGDARPAGGLRADLGDLRPPVLAPRDGGRPRRRSRASSSSPRSTGTSSGPSSSRASTTPTTSGSTTASRRATPARSASTSSRASTSRTAWPASWRTTTSPGPPPRSRPRCTGPPPS